MPRLTHDQRVQVVTLKNDAGWTVNRIAEHLHTDRRTVQRLLAKHRNTGSVEDQPHPRRPRRSTLREDRILVRMSAAAPMQVARQLRQRWNTEHGVEASVATVKRRLKDAGLHGRIAKRKPLLSQRHKTARLAWARQRSDWTVEQWQRCFFTDESPLHLVNSHQRRYVRRRGGTAMRPEHIRPTVHASSGKILVWGGFFHNGTRVLARVQGRLNAEGYCNLLREHVVPLNLQANNQLLQQDNATCHSARRTQTFLRENNITLLPWPAQSPDLNPIENLWSQLQQQVDRRVVHGLDGLWDAALEEWNNLDNQVLTNLVDSMPRRVQQLIAANGGAIPY